uniref:ABC transporter domain-containing protein n=1 Tax=Kalanchoe fedtschenkoi TaxID=63787 RepID=A0A7N0SV87_KALFE
MPPTIDSANAFSDEVREHLLAVDPEEEEEALKRSAAKLKLRGLTRVSDAGVEILKGIDLDIPRGLIVGVIGPSGSGKSTMLRALNRLWEPASGTVFLDGVDICEVDVVSLRRKVGMLFQLPALFEGQLLN